VRTRRLRFSEEDSGSASTLCAGVPNQVRESFKRRSKSQLAIGMISTRRHFRGSQTHSSVSMFNAGAGPIDGPTKFLVVPLRTAATLRQRYSRRSMAEDQPTLAPGGGSSELDRNRSFVFHPSERRTRHHP